MNRNVNIGLLISRIAIGGPMLLYGIGKLVHGIDFIQQLLVSKGLPSVFGYGVYIGEVVAPLLLLIGFRTRIVAAVFAINCLTAMLLAQSSDIFSLNDNGGWKVELLGMYILIAVALYFTGGGKYAISTDNSWD
ncbi:DoxX family protein [Myroides injenensis]|uniref:DoxX family protein n=1 Tax=Myroides injenensis TaxID=1183151 RepID=UPI000288D982|nr:DoxX family protein [Myroides injenensis]